MDKNRENFIKALKEAGLPEELADTIRETTAQQVGQAGFAASVDTCDEAGRVIKVMMQERQMIY